MQAGKPKSERKASAEARAIVRPLERIDRRKARKALKNIKKIDAVLSEDRKRSYLATYTVERKAAREAKRAKLEHIVIEGLERIAVAPEATLPAEAVTNEAR